MRKVRFVFEEVCIRERHKDERRKKYMRQNAQGRLQDCPRRNEGTGTGEDFKSGGLVWEEKITQKQRNWVKKTIR